MLQVIKLGGATLATPEKINQMAKTILGLKHKGHGVIAVVSAMGDTTNKLYEQFLQATNQKGRIEDLESFLGLGELVSAKLLQSTLSSLGDKVEVLSPYQNNWPLKIKIKSHHFPLKQKKNEEKHFSLLPETRHRLRASLKKLLKDKTTAVITGFIAQNEKGQVVTFGRGGSDISAFLIAKLVGADEIILAKDVPGVLAWDPSYLGNYKKAPHVSFLDSRDLFILSRSGARVVHPQALKYLDSKTRARVVSLNETTWDDAGTIIETTEHAKIIINSTELAAITFIGQNLEETSGILNTLTLSLKDHKIPIHGVSVSDKSLAFYIPKTQALKAYEFLVEASREIPELKSSTIKENLVKITLRSHGFIDSPGIIEKLTKPLAKAGINIWELVTIHDDISFFIEEKDAKQTTKLLSNSLSGKTGSHPRVAQKA